MTNKKSSYRKPFYERFSIVIPIILALLGGAFSFGWYVRETQSNNESAELKSERNVLQDSLSNLIIENTKNTTQIDSLITLLKIATRDTIILPPDIDSRKGKIKNLIAQGLRIAKKDVNKDSTINEFIAWRLECIRVIASVYDNGSAKKTFEVQTKLGDDNYPQIPTIVTKGIEILKGIQGKLSN